MTIKILWNIGGRFGIQPAFCASTDNTDEGVIERMRNIMQRRKPRPEKCEVMGGNCELCLFVISNEVAFAKKNGKPPAVVGWAARKFAAEFGVCQVITERFTDCQTMRRMT